MITVLARKKYRQTTYVLAENVKLNKTFVSKIVLDKISTLNIVTKPQKLYLNESPKKFILCAKDDRNNSFTSLEGLKFNWQIETINSNSMKLIDRKNPEVIQKIVDNGSETFQIFLKGVNIGCAKVRKIFHFCVLL